MSLRFLTDMIWSAGGREYNEDYCNFLTCGNAGCWLLADGLGGHGGGEVASQLAADTVMGHFQSVPEMSADALNGYFAAANAAILEQQRADPRHLRMATTLVVLVSDFASALWGHIGDSRLYHFRDGRASQLTKDHSVAQSLCDAGKITPAEIRFHPDRSSLRRSLGKGDQAEAALPPEPIALQPGDAFLLASDGFWEYVTETEMEVELSKAGTPGDWLKTMEERLRGKATGEFDNYSAVGVLVEEQP